MFAGTPLSAITRSDWNPESAEVRPQKSCGGGSRFRAELDCTKTINLNKKTKRKMIILSLRNSVNHAPLRRGVLLIALTLASFALSPTAKTQLPPSLKLAGGGGVFQTGPGRGAHGFGVHCGTDANASSIRNNLDINGGPDKRRHHFQLDPVLISSDCFYDPSVGSPNPPPAGFNTIVGLGTGKFDGKTGATINFTF